MNLNRLLVFFSILLFVLSSCGVVVGGSKYNAIIEVPNHSNADIYYKGSKIGSGSTSIKLPRNLSNRLVFAVKTEECDEQQFEFKSRTFRGWSFVTSIVFFTTSPLLTGIPVPYGGIIDLASGAVWKPNKAEVGVHKIDYKNYKYELNYSQCPTELEKIKLQLSTPKSKESKLKELNDLLKKGLISEEEYKESRAKILAQ